MSASSLSPDTLTLVLSLLAPSDLAVAVAACRRWRDAASARDSFLWRHAASTALNSLGLLTPCAPLLIDPASPAGTTYVSLLYFAPRWPRGFDAGPMITVRGHEHEMAVEREWDATEVRQEFERIREAVNNAASLEDRESERQQIAREFPALIEEHSSDCRSRAPVPPLLTTPADTFYANLRIVVERERAHEDVWRQVRAQSEANTRQPEPRPLESPADEPNQEEIEASEGIDRAMACSSTRTRASTNVMEGTTAHTGTDNAVLSVSIPAGATQARPPLSVSQRSEQNMEAESDTESEYTTLSIDEIENGNGEWTINGDVDLDENDDEDADFSEMDEDDEDYEEDGSDLDEEEYAAANDVIDGTAAGDDGDAGQFADPDTLWRRALGAYHGHRGATLAALGRVLQLREEQLALRRRRLEQEQQRLARLSQTTIRIGTAMYSDEQRANERQHERRRHRRKQRRWAATNPRLTAISLSDSDADNLSDSDSDECKSSPVDRECVTRVRYSNNRQGGDRAIVLDEPFPVRHPQHSAPFTVVEWITADTFQHRLKDRESQSPLPSSSISTVSQSRSGTRSNGWLRDAYVPVARLSRVAYFEISIEHENTEEVNRRERAEAEERERRRRDRRARHTRQHPHHHNGDAEDSQGASDSGSDDMDGARGAAHLFAARSQCVALGLCTPQFPLTGRQPGWDRFSYAYHGDDGNVFHGAGSGARFGPSYGAGDTVGLILNYVDGSVSFTRNGRFVGVHPATRVAPLVGEWFGCVGLDSRYIIRANLHGPFVFDIQQFECSVHGHRPPIDFAAARALFQASDMQRRAQEAERRRKSGPEIEMRTESLPQFRVASEGMLEPV